MAQTIVIKLEMPPLNREKCSPKMLETQVKEAIEHIDSGYESKVEWSWLRSLYKSLEKRDSSRAKNLRAMMQPTLAKYGYHV